MIIWTNIDTYSSFSLSLLWHFFYIITTTAATTTTTNERYSVFVLCVYEVKWNEFFGFMLLCIGILLMESWFNWCYIHTNIKQPQLLMVSLFCLLAFFIHPIHSSTFYSISDNNNNHHHHYSLNNSFSPLVR